MAFPKPFTTASPFIASYNWIDMIDKTGFLRMYLGAYHTSTKDVYNYALNKNTFKTAETTLISTWNYGAPETYDLDWESSTFSHSQIVGGEMEIIISTVTQTARNSYSTPVFKLIKVDSDSNETIIATLTGYSITDENDTYVYLQNILTMRGTVANTHLEIGDKLLFRISITSGGGDSNHGSRMYIITDPENKEVVYPEPPAGEVFTIAAGDSISYIDIPFRMDV